MTKYRLIAQVNIHHIQLSAIADLSCMGCPSTNLKSVSKPEDRNHDSVNRYNIVSTSLSEPVRSGY